METADIYTKYRPQYPLEYSNYLVSYNSLTADKTIADIGSGTGVLTQQLLEKNLKVIAVEPNDDMRRIVEKKLNSYPNFVSINGTADNLDSFIGRNLSDSFAPKSTDSSYKEFTEAINELFMKYSKDNKIILPNITRSYIGKV